MSFLSYFGLAAMVFSAVLGASVPSGFAQEKKKAVPVPQQQIAPAPTNQSKVAQNASEETLFYTLNETLEENRKIRVSLKEMQQAYEKRTIENEELKAELKKLEGLALERNRELLNQTKALEMKLKETEASAVTAAQDHKQFNEEKEKILAEINQAQAENEKLRTLLANSILEEEKEALMRAAQQNGVAAQKAHDQLTRLNQENQAYKNNVSEAYYEMGNVLFQIRKYPEAAANYRKVIEHDPAHAWAYYNLAVLEDYYLNNAKSAYEHYQLYLNYKPVEEEAGEVRRRILDLNLIQKMTPTSPLKSDFDSYHKETNNPKF
ncbi:MAG TPA: tetratricopeptide repeat protein [Candidatus Omnitrophota bacterium]|nr:tetratricopeptide repeat protein [Candidatus Omnitrophota bacterium]